MHYNTSTFWYYLFYKNKKRLLNIFGWIGILFLLKRNPHMCTNKKNENRIVNCQLVQRLWAGIPLPLLESEVSWAFLLKIIIRPQKEELSHCVVHFLTFLMLASLDPPKWRSVPVRALRTLKLLTLLMCPRITQTFPWAQMCISDCMLHMVLITCKLLASPASHLLPFWESPFCDWIYDSFVQTKLFIRLSSEPHFLSADIEHLLFIRPCTVHVFKSQFLRDISWAPGTIYRSLNAHVTSCPCPGLADLPCSVVTDMLLLQWIATRV